MALLAKTPSQHDSGDEAPDLVVEINITPLTDVFLVLLIIFMVTSSVMSQLGVDVNLPKASAQTAQAQPQGVIVTLLPDGGIKVNGAAVNAGDFATMSAKIRAAFNDTTSRTVILEGDRQAYLGSAIEVMDWAKRAGADKFAIATSSEAGAGR